MNNIVISGTGLYVPQDKITNEELVASFNQYVKLYNEQHKEEIAAGNKTALSESSVEFIVKASGIKNRYVINKTGILNPLIMAPRIQQKSNDQLSLQCEMSVAAARQAMVNANKKPADIDCVIVACSNMERAYPAIAIEVQHALGIEGYAFDMNVACSSVTFGIQTAYNALIANNARAVLVVNPEICSGHLNFRERDSHFIFGDICTAAIIERQETCNIDNPFEIISFKLYTQFSNNIRNNFGFMNHADPDTINNPDKLFMQNGRQVFKDIVPLVPRIIVEHLSQNNIEISQVKRLWLHQANINMNHLIVQKILGREATQGEAPIILDEYANTASAGSLIAFHLYHDDLKTGDLGVMCSFGAGYSLGNIILRRVKN